MKFLHVIPPHAVNAYNIIKFIKTHFSEDEHSILIMETRNWVINNCPRLLAFIDLHYLPEVNKKVFSKIRRLKTTMVWMDEAEHIVLHSIFSIRGKLFMPFFCKKRYAEKCIWIENYSDIMRWKHAGKGFKVRMHNRLLGNFLRSIPTVGTKLLSDKGAYKKYVGGNAHFYLAPYPTIAPEDLSQLLSILEETSADSESIRYADYQELFSECEECFRHQEEAKEDEVESEQEDHDYEPEDSEPEQEDHESEQEAVDAEQEDSKPCAEKVEPHILMVEGDMFARHNHFAFFRDISHLKDDGLLAANLNHVGKHCYSGSVSYRRMMYRAGRKFLGKNYIDFKGPNAPKEFFFKRISKVEGIAFFSQRTLNPQFIWLMLLMNKKVFLPGNSPLYKYLKNNDVPVFPHHFLRVMTMEQFLRPVRTDDYEWIRTFVDEEKIAACWEEMFLEAQQRKEGTS